MYFTFAFTHYEQHYSLAFLVKVKENYRLRALSYFITSMKGKYVCTGHKLRKCSSI